MNTEHWHRKLDEAVRLAHQIRAFGPSAPSNAEIAQRLARLVVELAESYGQEATR